MEYYIGGAIAWVGILSVRDTGFLSVGVHVWEVESLANGNSNAAAPGGEPRPANSPRIICNASRSCDFGSRVRMYGCVSSCLVGVRVPPNLCQNSDR